MPVQEVYREMHAGARAACSIWIPILKSLCSYV